MRLLGLRTAIQDRYTTESMNIGALDRFIAAAVRFYSRYNPYIKTTTVTTVSNQQKYDLPSDCVDIVDAEWYPLGELYAELQAGAEQIYLLQPHRKYRFHQPSDRIIDDIERNAYADRVTGRWEQENKQLVLWPEPTSAGTEVTVIYTSQHVLSSGAYSTIPNEDFDLLVNLVFAEILSARGFEMAIEPDYSEGLQRTTKRFVPGNTRIAVRELRQEVIDKYGRAAALVS